MQNANMDMSIFVFYGQKKGIPSENPFLFRKELTLLKTSGSAHECDSAKGFAGPLQTSYLPFLY